MTNDHHIPELLAPAGSPDALRAAVANGADAVYLGVDRLNARRGAENFTIETLGEATRHAHLADTKVFLTANVLVLPSEMRDALTMVDEAWAAGIDAVIVQDIGLLRVLRSALPHVRVHASTQIGAHNAATVGVLAELGVSRVTLAREVSVAEIASAVAAGAEYGVEVESFVHGALCICYSGQCLLSSMIGGRSANRGMCAQPCRLPYELRTDESSIEAPGAHLLSPKDLAGIDVLPELVATGVSALKIEGRMKSPEYVALVTGTYRAALDRALADSEGYSVRDGERSVLAEAFSRGFTSGYLTGERGNALMSYRRPNNRGVAIGRLSEVDGSRATVTLDAQLDPEDTIEVWTSAGRFTQRVGELEVDGVERSSASRGERAGFRIEGAASKGDRVFRVANAALLRAARRTFGEEAELVPLAFEARVVQGKPLSLTVTDRLGRSGYAEGPVMEAARTKAVTADEVTEHLGRLGGTQYTPASWDLELGVGVGVGFSALHRVRREAIADYERTLLHPWQDREAVHPRLPAPADGRSSRSHAAGPLLVASCESLETALAALEAGVDEAHVPTHALPTEIPEGVVPVVPRILHDREVSRALKLAASAPKACVANLGVLHRVAVDHTAVDAHWSLNAVNPWTCAALGELGAGLVWASPELTGVQLRDVVASSPVPVGIGVWGRQELMVTEHCILMAEGECAGACAGCERRAVPRYLKDRKGYEFPVTTDVTGRSHLYNAVSLDLSRALDEVLATGVEALRLDFAFESIEEVAATVTRWRSAISAARAGRTPAPVEPKGTATSGHFFRGVR